jgi:hypothetical protein
MLVQHEPTACDLMRRRYSAGECRVLFPSSGNVTVAQAAMSTILREELDGALNDQGINREQRLRAARGKIREHRGDLRGRVGHRPEQVQRKGAPRSLDG